MVETISSQPVPDGGAPAARPPWSPAGIAVLSILLSPFLGGVLHGLNYERLGRPRLKWLVVSRNLLTSTALLFLGLLDTPLPLTLGASLFLAAYFYKTQEPLFRRLVPEGGKTASLLVPAMLFLAILVMLGLLVFGISLFV